VSGLTAPDGDPAQLRQFAGTLETAAGAARKLGSDTPGVMDSIQTASAWTGPAADASTSLGDDLGGGVAATGTPLLKAADAVSGYASALETAQDDVGAYNLALADETMAGGADPAYLADVQRLATMASTSLDAWNTAGVKAAGTLQDASTDLSRVFTAGGPVRNYLVTLPADIAPSSVSGLLAPASTSTPAADLGPEILANPGAPVTGDLTDLGIADLGLGAILTNPGEPGLGAILTNPGAGDLGPTVSHSTTDDDNGGLDEGEGKPGDDEGENSGTGYDPKSAGRDITNEDVAQQVTVWDQAVFPDGEHPTYDEILSTLNGGTVTPIAGTPYVSVKGTGDNGRPVTILIDQTPNVLLQAWSFYPGGQNFTAPGTRP
jgi:hypothetical protein